MKKINLKLLAFVLTFALMISSLGVIAYADEKEGDSVTNTDVLEQTTETNENSYVKYLESNNGGFAKTERKYDVNSTLSAESVEFKITAEQ